VYYLASSVVVVGVEDRPLFGDLTIDRGALIKYPERILCSIDFFVPIR